jgi:DNA-directed RNA polymerase
VFKDEHFKNDVVLLISQNKKEFKKFKDYNRVKKAIDEQEFKDYLLEDIASFLSLELLKSIKNNTIYKNLFYKELLTFTANVLVDFDMFIDRTKLSQKPAFALITIFLTSQEIAWVSFATVSGLDSIKKDSEDKVDPTSTQHIIKELGSNILEVISNKLKREYLLEMQEIENEHLFEIFSEILLLLEVYEVIETNNDISESMITYKLNEKFYKNSKDILKNIIDYAKPSFEPMIVPPLKWNNIYDGGYLKDENSSKRFNLPIQKSKTKKDRKRLQKRADDFSKKLLEAVNIIQNTKWHINKKILKATSAYIEDEVKKVEKELKNQKEKIKTEKKLIQDEIDEIIKKTDQIDSKFMGKKELIEEMFSDSKEQKIHLEKLQTDRKAEKKELKEKLYKLIKEKKYIAKELYSYQNELKIKSKIVQIAQNYKDYDSIYFTWQVDFRGRIYPVQALLNPQGESLSKALLEFSEKKPLKKDGLKWLKIHGANSYGVDKVSFNERIKWVDKHQDDIVAVAKSKKPFDIEFLNSADKKFEFLAFCYEYSAYLENPDEFKSSLPVAVDGSNNGFQHIATLLRDSDGARKVNVLPSDDDTPADIYKEVALELKKLLKNDNLFENLIDKIDRSFVKKGVMTDSYGAGIDTKAQQIKDYIENKLELTLKDEELRELAKYLDSAIDKVAPSSAIYKKWINHIGKIISKKEKPIIWKTPFIEFEVNQVEYETKKDRIRVKFKNKVKTIQIQKQTDKIDTKKQAQGIAPNFIHSLDATHMYLTILSCYKQEIDSFATVHDSFATHACDIDTLLETLKEEFINLTNYNVLSHLQDEISKRYDFKIVNKLSNKKEDKVKQIENINNFYLDQEFDIEQIKDSTYFFS